jgi:hypothetical protein
MAMQPGRDLATVECEIARTDNFVEYLTVRHIAALPQQVLLEISSQLLTARNAEERQVRYRLMLDRSRLAQLGDLFSGGSQS